MHLLCINVLLLLALFSSASAVHHLQFIATFAAYHPLPVQESLIRSALSLTPHTAWHILPRANLAARTLPTDFVLLETSDPSVISELRAASFIRSVTSQGEHGRKLRALIRNQTADFVDPDVLNPVSRIDARRFTPVVHAFGAGELWRLGFTGEGVKVAVFDTGLIADDTNFAYVAERTDWTGENTTDDVVGHGTFVAGLIAGSHPACPGIAPHATLHSFRVFTGAQVSYTSWFLDAFNYALHIGIDVLNLSIGGPDFADSPFTDKVNELTANGVIIVSAIGNDGPLWGSLNNPGDMMEVVGVGGAEPDGSIAKFSSRGMTTHELDGLHASYGRVKPDLVAYARSLVGPSHRDPLHCRKLSGTSVASPVVAGAIALLASTIPRERRRRVINPASVKRALIQSSHRLPGASVYEQGSGLLDINDAYKVIKEVDAEVLSAMSGIEQMEATMQSRRNIPTLSRMKLRRPSTFSEFESTIPGPRAAFFPSFYDLSPEGCPHMWPHCAQPMFEGGMPISLNVTVLNPGGVQGRIDNITWINGQNGQFLDVKVTPPKRFWPWAAGMGIHLSVKDVSHKGIDPIIAEGVLQIRVVSVHKKTHSDIELPVRVMISDIPERKNRLLWDMFHSIRYPPGYVPRDNLAEGKDMLDWLGDHPHTNFHSLFQAFREDGFHIDILESPITCVPSEKLKQYGGLLILDSEDYFSINETKLLENFVVDHGLALIVAAEWHNSDLMGDIRFEDDNTRSWWSPIVAGGNVPALNEMLTGFGISFGDAVVSGDVGLEKDSFRFESGVTIVQFPKGGELLYVPDLKVHGRKRIQRDSLLPDEHVPAMPILGLVKSGAGAVLTFGDTNCIDTAYSGKRCYDFFVRAVRHTVSKCAGLMKCEKMLSESRLLKNELVPLLTVLRRRARPPSADSMALFKPHSKVLANRDALMDGGPEQAFCVVRNMCKRIVSVNGSELQEVSFPRPKRAEPLGSDLKYFRSLGQGWLHRSRRSQHEKVLSKLNSHVFATPLSESDSRRHSAVFVFAGIGLIALSFALRSRRPPTPQFRNFVKRRIGRSRQSLSFSSPSRSASNLSGSRTLSSVLSVGSTVRTDN